MGALLLVCGALLSSGLAGGTFALYEGATENAGSTFAGGWIGAATGLTATPEGYDVALKWTPGTHGPVTGQKLYGVDNEASSTCTEAPTLISRLESGTTSSYNDESRGNATNDGDWFCYQLQSTSASEWTAQATQAVQLGLVANGLSTKNAASTCTKAPKPESGKIDCKDTITITFNQKPNLVEKGTIVVCVFATENLIVLGEGPSGITKCGAKPNGAYTVGEMTVSGAKIKANAKFEKSPYTLTASAPWETAITLETATTNSAIEKEGSSTPTWTFIPASTIKSSVKTHEATICSAVKTTCRPATTSDF